MEERPCVRLSLILQSRGKNSSLSASSLKAESAKTRLTFRHDQDIEEPHSATRQRGNRADPERARPWRRPRGTPLPGVLHPCIVPVTASMRLRPCPRQTSPGSSNCEKVSTPCQDSSKTGRTTSSTVTQQVTPHPPPPPSIFYTLLHSSFTKSPALTSLLYRSTPTQPTHQHTGRTRTA